MPTSKKLDKCQCGATFIKESYKEECDGCLFKKINEKDKEKYKFDFRVLA